MIDSHTKVILQLSNDPVSMVQTMHFATQQDADEAAKFAIDLQLAKEKRSS